MMIPILILALLADPAPPVVTAAEPPVPIRAVEVSGSPGRAVRLIAESIGPVRWELADPNAADLIPSTDGKSAAFVAPVPGRYLVLAYTATGDKPSPASRIVVVVGDTPKPPDPQPSPPGPVPPDSFAVELAKLYRDDPLQLDHKRQAIVLLTELYRQAETLAADTSIETLGELAGRVSEAGRTLARDRLASLRQRIATEVRTELGSDPSAKLTPETRQSAAKVYRRIHEALKKVEE